MLPPQGWALGGLPQLLSFVKAPDVPSTTRALGIPCPDLTRSLHPTRRWRASGSPQQKSVILGPRACAPRTPVAHLLQNHKLILCCCSQRNFLLIPEAEEKEVMEGQGSPEPPPLHTSEGITLGTTQHSWTPGSLLDPLLGFVISVMPCLF